VSDVRRSKELLRGVDAPRAPRPAFAHALREELFGAATVSTPTTTDDEDVVVDAVAPDVVALQPRRPQRTRWFLAAASIALTVGAVATVVVRSQNDQVDVSQAPPAVVADTEAACARFEAAAFGDVTREELVGSSNDATLTELETARALITELRSALAAFAAELEAAGIDHPDVFASLDVARGEAASALAHLDRGSLDQAAEEARLVETELIDLERALAEVGVVACL
jgi:hypothetical protein